MKIKWKNIILLTIIFICIIGLIFSITNIIRWMNDSNKTEIQIKKIEEIVDIKEVKDTKKVEIIKQKEKLKKSDPYFDYIKMNLINVDFKKLKKVNTDTKGWIKVNGTNINYPFVQYKDNKFYLNHSFDKSYNSAGWVFLDYRNNVNNLDRNTIIYAHGRYDQTMFGSLKNILKSNWFHNTNNYVVKLSTEKENTLWQVFSIYRIPTTNDYIQVDFNSDKEFISWSNMLIKRSSYNFNTSINEFDKILTLSTCYNDNDKVVMHAKLIKKEAK